MSGNLILVNRFDPGGAERDGLLLTVFSQPAPVPMGNMGPLVSNLRNHHIDKVEMSLFQQFRAEAINLMTRVRFRSPNTDVTGGANSGRVTSQSNDPQKMQFGLKLIW